MQQFFSNKITAPNHIYGIIGMMKIINSMVTMGCLGTVHSAPVMHIVLIIYIIPIIHIPHIVLTHRPACYAHSGVVTGLWGR